MKKLVFSVFALSLCLLFINIQSQFAAGFSEAKTFSSQGKSEKNNSSAVSGNKISGKKIVLKTNARKQASLWRQVSEELLKSESHGLPDPEKYLVFRLNKTSLTELLADVPTELKKVLPEKSVIMELPMPDGSFTRFRIEESSVLEPELAARFPEIKSYRGQGIDDPTLTTRFDWTPQGFHALVLSDGKTVNLEPANVGDASLYISYYGDDLKKGEYSCLVKDFQKITPQLPQIDAPQVSVGSTLRNFRIAIATDYEYTTAYGGGTVAGTVASLNTWLNGANLIYEQELSIHLNLVNNTSIIYTTADDPYNNSDIVGMLTTVSGDLYNKVGEKNYDIGHVMGYLGGGASGVSFVGVACLSNGAGATLMGGPAGNSGTLGVWVHELGHEFGADHNYNGTQGNCGGSRSNEMSYESGSGSTIMGYPQICGSDNISNGRDMRFHTMSYAAINSYLASYGTCAVTTATGNNAPTISGGGNRTIPKNTPFALTATASDPNGDSLTYNWEQIDAGGSGYPQNGTAASYNDVGDPSSTTRPIFRPYQSKTSPSRIFPDIYYIVNYANDPPDTINGFQTAEELPRIGRTLNFRVTARDNRTGGGGVNEDTVRLTVDNNSGPFLVISPNTNVSLSGGTTQTITWSVNNTNAAPVNATSVKISLSTDGGNTFPTVLAANTPNDGSESVIIPNTTTTSARIKVEAVGNIFFDISNSNFSITAGTGVAQGMEADVASRPNGDGVIQSNDVVQMTRFLNELDAFNTSTNEFQRADSAPRGTDGDGVINSADVVQTIRYLNELDATQSASGATAPTGGPTAPTSGRSAVVAKSVSSGAVKEVGRVTAPSVAPELRVESASGSAGNQVTVNIRVDAVGNEARYGFAVLFDPNVLSYTSFAAGETGSRSFSCNATMTAGRVRCAIGDFPRNQAGSSTATIGEIDPGNDQLLVKVIFTVNANAQSNTTTAVSLNSQSASDDNANGITPAVTNGTVTIAGATAAAAAIGGRVQSAAGRGVANAQVEMTNSLGERRMARTNGFGYFWLAEVASGETYTVMVKSKQYKFTAKVITVTQDVEDLNFIALSN